MAWSKKEATALHNQMSTQNTYVFDVDVNECDTGNGGCDQMCTNNDGSFQCSCNQGFVLAGDTLSCDGTYAKMLLRV